MSRTRAFLRAVGEWSTYLGDLYVEGDRARYRAQYPMRGGGNTGPR